RANVYISDYVPRTNVFFNFSVRDNLCGETTAASGRFSGRVVQDGNILNFFSRLNSNPIVIDTDKNGILAEFCSQANGDEDDDDGGRARHVRFGSGTKWLYMLDEDDRQCLSEGENACAIIQEGY